MKENQSKAKLDGVEIGMAVRYGRNGRKYVWEYPTQEQLDKLIAKYDYDQIADGSIRGEKVNVVWLEY